MYKMLNSEFKDTFELTRRCMIFLGVWPKSRKNFFSKVRFFAILFFVLFITLIPAMNQIFTEKNELKIVVEVLNLFLMTLVSWCKLLNQWLKGRGNNAYLFQFFNFFYTTSPKNFFSKNFFRSKIYDF